MHHSRAFLLCIESVRKPTTQATIASQRRVALTRKEVVVLLVLPICASVILLLLYMYIAIVLDAFWLPLPMSYGHAAMATFLWGLHLVVQRMYANKIETTVILPGQGTQR